MTRKIITAGIFLLIGTVCSPKTGYANVSWIKQAGDCKSFRQRARIFVQTVSELGLAGSVDKEDVDSFYTAACGTRFAGCGFRFCGGGKDSFPTADNLNRDARRARYKDSEVDLEDAINIAQDWKRPRAARHEPLAAQIPKEPVYQEVSNTRQWSSTTEREDEAADEAAYGKISEASSADVEISDWGASAGRDSWKGQEVAAYQAPAVNSAEWNEYDAQMQKIQQLFQKKREKQNEMIAKRMALEKDNGLSWEKFGIKAELQARKKRDKKSKRRRNKRNGKSNYRRVRGGSSKRANYRRPKTSLRGALQPKHKGL